MLKLSLHAKIVIGTLLYYPKRLAKLKLGY